MMSRLMVAAPRDGARKNRRSVRVGGAGPGKVSWTETDASGGPFTEFGAATEYDRPPPAAALRGTAERPRLAGAAEDCALLAGRAEERRRHRGPVGDAGGEPGAPPDGAAARRP